VIEFTVEPVTLETLASSKVSDGVLRLSNARVIFTKRSKVFLTIALRSIDRIEKIGGSAKRNYGLKFHCKDLRIFYFRFNAGPTHSRREFFDRCVELAWPVPTRARTAESSNSVTSSSTNSYRSFFCYVGQPKLPEFDSNLELSESDAQSNRISIDIRSLEATAPSEESSERDDERVTEQFDDARHSEQSDSDEHGTQSDENSDEQSDEHSNADSTADSNVGSSWGWDIYNASFDFRRMGIEAPRSKWRCTELNRKYKLCDSYPRTLAVPQRVDDDALQRVVHYRSRNRFPVCVWASLDKVNSACVETDATSAVWRCLACSAAAGWFAWRTVA
jgi:hypothetical protein